MMGWCLDYHGLLLNDAGQYMKAILKQRLYDISKAINQYHSQEKLYIPGVHKTIHVISCKYWKIT